MVNARFSLYPVRGITRPLCDLPSCAQLGYFKQRTVAGEVGSSTMPHKVRTDGCAATYSLPKVDVNACGALYTVQERNH